MTSSFVRINVAASGGVGFFTGVQRPTLGGFGAYGANAGKDVAFGLGAGAGIGGFLTNANRPEDLAKTTDTYIINLGFVFDLGISVSTGNGIWIVEVSPPGGGLGGGVSAGEVPTTTKTFDLGPDVNSSSGTGSANTSGSSSSNGSPSNGGSAMGGRMFSTGGAGGATSGLSNLTGFVGQTTSTPSRDSSSGGVSGPVYGTVQLPKFTVTGSASTSEGGGGLLSSLTNFIKNLFADDARSS